MKRYHGQVVETDDFRHVLEEHSGRALGKFFDQWFHSPGYPALKVTFKYDDKHKQGTFEIEQTQVDQEKGIPAFTLSTDLAWTIDEVEHRVPVRLEEAKHVVTVPMEAKPQQVRFDPLAKTLHKLEFNPGDPMLRAQLTGAKDVIGRIQAAHELAKTGKRANIQAIVDAYADEPFWGVREQFAQALVKADTEAAVAGLARIVGLEQHPWVLASLFRAAGNYRDARIRDAIVARLEGGFQPEQPAGLPYVATAAAYEALGKQRQEAEWDLLVEGAGRDSFNGYAQSGALRGLAETRRAEAIDLLLERVAYGATSNRARPAAVTALAEIGKGQEKVVRERVVERLVDLLRDPWDRVSRFAALGLRTVKAPEALGTLEAYGRRLSHQEQVFVERLVKALRAEDKVDGSAVKKQVEELQEKMRKLEDQVQKLQAKLEPAEPKERQ
jgi:aminopeptidase N